jgi:F0F1-type ATP synthase assembly protein I
MKTATQIALLQLLIGGLGAGGWAVNSGLRAGLAAACGGGIAALLTFYTGLKTFGIASENPEVLMRNFYRAQARKLALAVVLFGVAVQLFGNNFAPLITTFAVSLSVYWFALLWKS